MVQKYLMYHFKFRNPTFYGKLVQSLNGKAKIKISQIFSQIINIGISQIFKLE